MFLARQVQRRRTRLIRRSATHAVLLVMTIAPWGRGNAFEGEADQSPLLAEAWNCGTPYGPRFELWLKSVLLFASTNGYGFKAHCDSAIDTDSGDLRWGMLLVTFRDRNKVTQHVGWYDSGLDEQGADVFGGVEPLTAVLAHNPWSTPRYSEPILTTELYQQVWEQIYSFAMNVGPFPTVMAQFTNHMDEHATKTDGCVTPYTLCTTWSRRVPVGNDGDYYSIKFDVDGINGPGTGEEVYGRFRFQEAYDPGLWVVVPILISVATAITLGVIGAEIGLSFGLAQGTASLAAFSAGFAGFTTGVTLGGADPLEALLTGLQGASLAYVGTLAFDAFANPGALVGVSGIGCPRGDQCWFLELLNGAPPVSNLAQLHDPFIDLSIDAFGALADNPFYLAVTIPPFVVPGCAASVGCVTAGIAIVKEDELQ